MTINTATTFTNHELFSNDVISNINKKLKLLTSVIIGTAIAFSLFVIMDLLISNNDIPPPILPKTNLVSIVLDPPKMNIITKPVSIPPPPPIIQPPKLMKTQAAKTISQAPVIDISTPNLSITDGNLLTGAAGIGDAMASPIFRVEPQYPVKAAQKGIEGWVDLAFNIDELGQVVDIEVVDSQPKRIFNRAARKALKRWKYKAKISKGKTIKTLGLSVRLDFTMAN